MAPKKEKLRISAYVSHFPKFLRVELTTTQKMS